MLDKLLQTAREESAQGYGGKAWSVLGDYLIERGGVRGRIVELERQIAILCRARQAWPHVASGKPLDSDLHGRDRHLREELYELYRDYKSQLLGGWVVGGAVYTDWFYGFPIQISATQLNAEDVQTGPLLDGLRQLASDPHSSSALMGLHLGRHDLSGDAVRLTNSGILRTLRRLGLPGCNLGSDAVEVLAPHLGNVLELRLSGNPVGTYGVTALARHLCAVRHLTLSKCGVSCTTAIANSDAMGNLVSLDLGRNEIQDIGAIELAQSRKLGSLQDLTLLWNQIGVMGAQALTAGGARQIDLRWNGLPREQLEQLKRAAAERGCTVKLTE